MCGILLHYSTTKLEQNDSDYNSINISEYIEKDLENTTKTEPATEIFASNQTFQSLIPKILSRGSDFCKYSKRNDHLELFSSVLSLRHPFTQQPMHNESYILQFNGELYNKEIDGNNHENDTAFIFEQLLKTQDVIKTIGLLEGEFAYSIYDIKALKIYFGKDILGKKSLSYSLIDGELFVSSCMPSNDIKSSFKECLSAKLYTFDINQLSLEVVDYSERSTLPADYIVNGIPSCTIEDQQKSLLKLKENLTTAVKSRIRNIFPLHESSSNFGVLFSGGLDCTLLACLAASLSPPGTKIDLLNVSFYNPRTKTDPSSTPDRKLSLKSWHMLYKMFIEKGVEFQLVEVDVPYEEYTRHRKRVIELIYPNDTEMDLSIAIAFYFASRGIGRKVIYSDSTEEFGEFERETFESKCKVLLSGLGADELFGGYTRHERVFTYISNDRKRQLQGLEPKDSDHNLAKLYTDLQVELQQDLSNLHVRNLARDDKLISSWSKELRYPFLDTHFINFVTIQIPLMLKLNYDDKTGQITRKYILRLLAEELGMYWVASEAKRAIQFGAKSAKMEQGTGKMKGTDKLV